MDVVNPTTVATTSTIGITTCSHGSRGDSHPGDLACQIRDEKMEKVKVWRFRDGSEAARFQSLVTTLNTSGATLSQVSNKLQVRNELIK